MRDTKKIREWMFDNRWRLVDIARDLKIKHVTHIWETIEDKRNSRRVLRWFIDNGCPKGYLGQPDNIKEVA